MRIEISKKTKLLAIPILLALLVGGIVNAGVVDNATANQTKVEIVNGVPTINGVNIPLPPGVKQGVAPQAINYPDTSTSYTDYDAIFGKQSNPTYLTSQTVEISNLTFYVPVPVNAQIEGSGEVANFYGSPFIMMTVDGYMNSRWYLVDQPRDCTYCQIGFQISNVYYLAQGTHTVRLYAFDFNLSPGEFIYQQSITANVNARGRIQTD